VDDDQGKCFVERLSWVIDLGILTFCYCSPTAQPAMTETGEPEGSKLRFSIFSCHFSAMHSAKTQHFLSTPTGDRYEKQKLSNHS
jgi:hypothetical protein